jgi:hypothetical protein
MNTVDLVAPEDHFRMLNGILATGRCRVEAPHLSFTYAYKSFTCEHNLQYLRSWEPNRRLSSPKHNRGRSKFGNPDEQFLASILRFAATQPANRNSDN